MDRASEAAGQQAVLRVFFENPFWVGVFERTTQGRVSVSRVTFGPEPKDYEVWDYLLRNYSKLRFSPSVEAVVKETGANPKRVRRQARRELQQPGIGTKSQQALKLQQEEQKTRRKTVSRRQREAEKQRMFELKQQKRKEKHKGR